ncbi:MAG: class D sortase [Candidatus Saccharimonadales bacterium]
MDPKEDNQNQNQDDNQSFQLPEHLQSLQSDLQKASQDNPAAPTPQTPDNTHQIQSSSYGGNDDAQNAINQVIQQESGQAGQAENANPNINNQANDQSTPQPQPQQPVSHQPEPEPQPPQAQPPQPQEQPSVTDNTHPPIHTFKRRTGRDPEAAARNTPTDPGSMELPPRTGGISGGVAKSSVPPPAPITNPLKDIQGEELKVEDNPDNIPGLSFTPQQSNNEDTTNSQKQQSSSDEPMQSSLPGSKSLENEPATPPEPQQPQPTPQPQQPIPQPEPQPQEQPKEEQTTPDTSEVASNQDQRIDLQQPTTNHSVPEPEPEPQPQPQTPTPAPQAPPESTPNDTFSFTETVQPTEHNNPAVTRMDEEITTPQTKSLLDNFKTKAVEKGKQVKKINYKPLVSAGVFGIFVFILFNSQIILGQVQYLTTPSGGLQAPTDTVDPNAAVGGEQNIIIPKINVDIPVVYDISTFEESAVQTGLERGVVHYGNTAMPGEIGNTVIVGHSSHNWWDSGQYKFAFILLDRLEVGDQVILNYEGTRYVYEIRDKFVVEPTNVSVLNQPKNESMLTLITCTPPGTSWQRLIVQAEQISPDPSENTENQAGADESIDMLPSDSGGGVGSFVRGLFSNDD